MYVVYEEVWLETLGILIVVSCLGPKLGRDNYYASNQIEVDYMNHYWPCNNI